jgi:hypothetical protein
MQVSCRPQKLGSRLVKFFTALGMTVAGPEGHGFTRAAQSRGVPQRLKPRRAYHIYGTAEAVPLAFLKRSHAAFAVADAEGFIDPGDENFSVADLSRSGRGDDGLHSLFQQFVRNHSFDLDLG